jgi:hypothetical protein
MNPRLASRRAHLILGTAWLAALSFPTITRADFVLEIRSATSECDTPWVVDITFTEPVDRDTALDSFNYSVYASALTPGLSLSPSVVLPRSDRDTSFRLILEPGEFVPDSRASVMARGVTTASGIQVRPTLVPVTGCARPRLAISPARNGLIQLQWATNRPGYRLESASATPGPLTWAAVTNAATATNDSWATTINAKEPPRVFRLSKP